MMTALSMMAFAAVEYAVDAGMAVFPCLPRSKMPAVGALKADGTKWRRTIDPPEARAILGGFHRATTDRAQIEAWWRKMPDANVAVRLGGSLRLCCIEADTDEANSELTALSVGWPATWQYQASRGTNWLFAAPDDIPERPVRNLWPETFGKGVECKTGLGFIVAPPSVHPNGHVYRWIVDPFTCPLAPLPVVLADEVRRLDADRHRPVSPVRAVVSTEFDPVRTLDALRHLDENDYSTWVEVGLALKSTGDARARGVWDTWSAGSKKYDKEEQARQWECFAPTGITINSIFFHAKQAGWRAPRQAA